MRIKSNRQAKYRQYITTLNRFMKLHKMSEKRRNNIEAIDEATREAFKE